MTPHDAAQLKAASRLGSTTNLIHGFIYFAPEATEEYDALGLADRQHYFASRAAAMGAVTAEVVVATFYNFSPDVVAPAIPSAWNIADPEAIQAARLRAAGRVLDRVVGDVLDPSIDRATELTTAICEGVGYEGKPLAAGNRGVSRPDSARLWLWQLITTVREWRGDAHLAALGAAGVGAVEALVLHAATGQVPKSALQSTRGWGDQRWDATVARLAEQGLLQADGSFTPEGEAFRTEIEAVTNRACVTQVETIGVEATHELCDLLRPTRDALMASDVFANLGR